MTIADVARLFDGKRWVALTGAGCSTESGIPDYRGEGTRARARTPVEYQTFRADPAVRRRYWARSALGWPRFGRASPNPAHHALAALERDHGLLGVITQNVDGLHQRAGSRNVIELHGALQGVRCLDCDARSSRDALQSRLLELNPGISAFGGESLPDGDAELPSAWIESFTVAACTECGGVLKPDVVFFGESVPRPVVDGALALLSEAEALLVVGSSLAVFSGFRFARAAAQRSLPIAVVNLGPSRADPLARVRVEERAGTALPKLASALTGA